MFYGKKRKFLNLYVLKQNIKYYKTEGIYIIFNKRKLHGITPKKHPKFTY